MSDKKKILFFAKVPMNYVILRPIHQELKKDPRLEIWFTSKYKGSLFPGKLYKKIGLKNEKLITHLRASMIRFDMFISPEMPIYGGKRAKFKIHTFHGVSFKGGSISKEALKYDKLFLYGEYQKRRFVERGILKPDDERFEMIGMPKLDCLVDGALDKSKIISDLQLNNQLPTLLYAPTWRHSSLESDGIEIIKTLSQMNLNILIKLHDHSYDMGLTHIDWKRELERLKAPNMRVIRDYDICPYLFIGDILLSDASSVSNEYTILDKPIIFFDSPEIYKRYGKRVDEESWMKRPGLVIQSVSELKDAIENSLKHPGEFSESRKQVADGLFYKPGTATERAVNKIYELLELKKPE